jgi:hypothetical protein
VKSGALRGAVLVEHFCLATALLLVGLATVLYRGRSFDHTHQIQITAGDLSVSPTVVPLDLASWPSGAAVADLESAASPGLISLRRRSSSDTTYQVHGDKGLELTELEWIFFNISGLQKWFIDLGPQPYDGGSESLYSLQTVMSISADMPAPGNAFDARSVALLAGKFHKDNLATLKHQLESACRAAIEDVIYKGGVETLKSYSEEFKKLEVRNESVSGAQMNTFIGSINEITNDGFLAANERAKGLEPLMKKWSEKWKPVRKKFNIAKERIPESFTQQIAPLFKIQGEPQDGSNWFPPVFKIRLEVTKFEFTEAAKAIDALVDNYGDQVGAQMQAAKQTVDERKSGANTTMRETVVGAALANPGVAVKVVPMIAGLGQPPAPAPASATGESDESSQKPAKAPPSLPASDEWK